MSATTKLEHLDRRNWWMWGTAFVLILSLTAAIPAFHTTALQLVGVDGEAVEVKSGYEALIGLVGLVSLFILYIILKQREIQTMRSRLTGESGVHGSPVWSQTRRPLPMAWTTGTPVARPASTRAASDGRSVKPSILKLEGCTRRNIAVAFETVAV